MVVLMTATICSFSQVNTENNTFTSGQDEKAYMKALQESKAYNFSRRANQLSGKIDPQHVIKAMNQVEALMRNKSGTAYNLSWDELGPNNFPGRIRTLLVDNENSAVLFAGSEAGGLWKSTVGGLIWEKAVKADGGLFESLSVSSITQASNGDIYFGTGNEFTEPMGDKLSGFNGQGIYKSTDRGATFARLASTWTSAESKLTFFQVNRVVVDPNNSQKVYAATAKGLRVSNDGGATWFNPIHDENAEENACDVAVGSDGTVIAGINYQAYLSQDGSDGSFVLKSDAGDIEDTGLLDSDLGRITFAFAPSDPNYVYCIAANDDASTTFRNVYQSRDNGETWRIIGPGGSSLFAPFSTSGNMSMAIAVAPNDPEYLVIAGNFVWIWSQRWAWEKLTLPTAQDYDELFVHNYQHKIVFDQNHPDTVYITNNGGVSRSIDGGYTYRRINKNLNTTQFVSVAASGSGDIVGGTFDNGTLYMDFSGADSMSAKKYFGTGQEGIGGYSAARWNSGQVEMSMMAPHLIFFSPPQGLSAQIDLEDPRGWPKAIRHWPSNGSRSGPFVTPVDLYENWNDKLSWDSIMFIADGDYLKGETITVDSWTAGRPLYKTLEENLYEGDTIKIQDTYGSVFVFGRSGKGGPKIQRRSLRRHASRITTCWGMINRHFLEDEDVVEEITLGTAHKDGCDVVYASIKQPDCNVVGTDDSKPYKLWRIKNLLECRDRRSTDPYTAIETYKAVHDIIYESDQVITSISVDPKNDNNVIITLGNYGNEYNVMYCTEAYSSDTISRYFAPSDFKSVQGNLPNMPVYSSLFDWENSNTVYLGTEHGMYSTRNISAATPAWADENQNGLERVPIFDIDMQYFENNEERGIYNHGVMYIATQGRGIFKTDTRKGSGPKVLDIKENNFALSGLSISPNPVQDFANVSFELKDNSNVEFNVYNVSGSMVKNIKLSSMFAGKHRESIDLNDLNSGSYILEMKANGRTSSSKFIIR